MRVELGARVHTADGQDIGSIEKLIVDPRSGEVQTAVVRKGFLMPDDVQIPIEAMQLESGGSVGLSYTADQVDELPRFVEAEYTPAGAGYVSPFGYPAAGLLWPAAYAPGAFASPAAGAGYGYGRGGPDSGAYGDLQRERNTTEAVIGEGSDVMSRDGDKIGEIHSVTVDPESGRPTRLVVRKGFFFTEELELPAEVIDSFDDGVVYLSLDKDQVMGEVMRLAGPLDRR